MSMTSPRHRCWWPKAEILPSPSKNEHHGQDLIHGMLSDELLKNRVNSSEGRVIPALKSPLDELIESLGVPGPFDANLRQQNDPPTSIQEARADPKGLNFTFEGSVTDKEEGLEIARNSLPPRKANQAVNASTPCGGYRPSVPSREAMLNADSDNGTFEVDSARGSNNALHMGPATDQEAAFWEGLLKTKTADIHDGAKPEIMKPPRNPAKGESKPQHRSEGRRKGGDNPTKAQASKQAAQDAENVPLPRARPGRNGITKLWLPGKPAKNPTKAAPPTTSSPKPGKLLQRHVNGNEHMESAEIGIPTSKSDGADFGSSTVREGDMRAAPAEQEVEAASGVLNVSSSKHPNDLDWLVDYIEQSSLPSLEPDPHPFSANPPDTHKEPTPTALNEEADEAGLRRESFAPRHPNSSDQAVLYAAQDLASHLHGLEEEAQFRAPARELTDEAHTYREHHESMPLPSANQPKPNEDKGGLIGEDISEEELPEHDSAAVEDEPSQQHDDAGVSSLWTVNDLGRSYRGYLSNGASTESSSEEDPGYSDLVDSMMQAWNGGILVANKKKQAKGHKKDIDSSAEEAETGGRGRIFHVPHSLLKESGGRKREKRKKSKKTATSSDAALSPGKLEKLPHPSLEELGEKAPAVPLMVPETKPLTPEELEVKVGQIKDVFPDINQTVAELTLQSYQGDVEEALNFLKMTTLTATPAQLGKLGLISKKSAQASDDKPPSKAASHSGSGSGDEALLRIVQNARHMTGSDLAESLLQASDPSEAIALAISGAELTVAEQERLREEESSARQHWMQRLRAKQIFNEAAAQMESKGQLSAAQHLRTLAYEQAKQANEFRRQCNSLAFRVSNQHVTNRVKLDLHGMSVDESLEKLEDHIARLTGLSSATFIIEVIVGVGKHSAGGIARLSPAVKQYLSNNQLTWHEERGNPGQINVIIAGSQQN